MLSIHLTKHDLGWQNTSLELQRADTPSGAIEDIAFDEVLTIALAEQVSVTARAAV